MAKRAADSRYRFVCFTIFEKPRVWYEEFKDAELPSGLSYLVFQLELCPTTKKEHIQGYAEAKFGKTYEAWKKVFMCKSVHLEGRKATAAQASEYCTDKGCHADGTKKMLGVDILLPHVMLGDISKQGKRSDLDEAALMIRMGSDLRVVAEAFPTQYIRYHSGFKALKLATNAPQRREGMHTFFVHGRPGCGKTVWANQTYPDAYQAGDHHLGWMDGYDGQRVIIMDEFEGLFPRQLMMRLMDTVPMQVPVKCGFVGLKCRILVITTNKRWQDCYCTNTGTDQAWVRRINDPRICTIIPEDDPRLEEAMEKLLLQESAKEADDIVPQTPESPHAAAADDGDNC